MSAVTCANCGDNPVTLEADGFDVGWCSKACVAAYISTKNNTNNNNNNNNKLIAAADTENGTGELGSFADLRSKLARKPAINQLAVIREEFKKVFPVENYPYKVMGFNRAKQGILQLNLDRSVAVALLFSHQQLNRDFRGPWTDMRGAIIKAPTGAGKTATMHSILSNYSRELVPLKTPVKFYLKPEEERVTSDKDWLKGRGVRKQDLELEVMRRKLMSDEKAVRKLTRAELASRLFESQDDHVNHVLIYVTKTELVPDVRKDFWAQKDRSQAAYTKLMEANGIRYGRSFAPFKPAVHVMSYKQFDNMLRGKNKAGRNLWAGLDIGADVNFEQIDFELEGIQEPSGIIVPTAYHRNNEGAWVRGNRTHAIESELFGEVRIVYTFNALTTFYPQTLTEFSEAIRETLQASVPSIVAVKSNNQEASRRANRTYVSLYFTVEKWSGQSAPDKPQIDRELRRVQGAAKQKVQQIMRKEKLGTLAGDQLRSLVPASTAQAGRGWTLGQVATGKKKPTYRWVRSDEGDWVFNPMDRVVVGFDEAHLIFNPDKLLAQESADADLIITALKQSEGARAFFTTATSDMLDGMRMADALMQESDERLAKLVDFSQETSDLLSAIEKNEQRLGNLLAGRISVTTVEGMRDLFPEKKYRSPVSYEISEEHAQNVLAAQELSVQALMHRINVNLDAFDPAFDIALDSFDPDKLLRTLVLQKPAEGTSAADPGPFPLGRVLLKKLRDADKSEAKKYGDAELTGRGVMTSSPQDDTLRLVAALMQAVGYQWMYLTENDIEDSIPAKVRNQRDKGQPIPAEWRSVRWGKAPLDSKASKEVLSQIEKLTPIYTDVEGEKLPPRFVVLSNALLVKQFGESLKLSETKDFYEQAMRMRNFALPYRVKNLSEVKRMGLVDEDTLNELRKGNKPILHLFPGTPEAREKAPDFDIFDSAEPFFFIERRKEPRFRKIQLPVDIRNFTVSELEDFAFKSASLNIRTKSDAKDMILALFNKGIESMRKKNLRYILLGRAYGQGFDVFNVTDVFNTEPAPDYATEVQRRGRFARPGSHASLSYERWVVSYRTLYAKFPPTVEIFNSRKGFSDLLESPEVAGSYAVLHSIDKDPVELAKRKKIRKKSLKTGVDLLPYEAVRIRVEDPNITLKRLQLEKVFNSWAVDLEHNEVKRDSDSERVYGATNYVVSGQFVADHFYGLLENRPAAQFNEKEEKERLFEERKSQLTDASGSPREPTFDEYKTILEQVEQEVLDRAAMSGEKSAIYDSYESYVEAFQDIQTLSIDRRLAEKPGERTLHVVYNGRRIELSIARFEPNEDEIEPLSLLRALTRRGFAQFDPRFHLESDKPKPIRAKPSRFASEQSGDDKEPKRRKEGSQDLPIVLEGEAPDIVSSEFRLPKILIGADPATEAGADEFVSFGTVIEKTAYADQEQEALEHTTLQKLAEIAQTISYYEDSPPSPSRQWTRNRYEELAAGIYQRLQGDNRVFNPTALKNAILELHRYGVMNWNNAVELIAHAVHSITEPPGRLSAEEKRKLLTRVATDMGRLYIIAMRDSNTAVDMSNFFAVWDTDNVYEPVLRSDLILIGYRVAGSLNFDNSLARLTEWIGALRKSYRVDLGPKSAFNVASLLATVAQNLGVQEELTLSALINGLSNGKGADVAGLDKASSKRYLERISALQAQQPNIPLATNVLDAEYAKENPKLARLASLASMLSVGQYTGVFTNPDEPIDDVLKKILDQSQGWWPVDELLTIVATSLGDADAMKELSRILSKAPTAPIDLLRQKAQSVKPSQLSSSLLYQDSEFSDPRPLYRDKNKSLFRKTDGGRVFLSVNEQTDYLRNGFLSDAWPRIRFDEESFQVSRIPDIDVWLSILQEWDHFNGLHKTFFLELKNQQKLPVVLLRPTEFHDIVELLDQNELNAGWIGKLLTQRGSDDATVTFVRQLVLGAEKLGINSSTITRLLIKEGNERRPSYYANENPSNVVLLRLWRVEENAAEFAIASTNRETIRAHLKLSRTQMEEEISKHAVRLDRPENFFLSVFDAVQQQRRERFIEETTTTTTSPAEDVMDVGNARPMAARDACLNCGKNIAEGVHCECERALYCNRKCQAMDYENHLQHCSSIRVGGVDSDAE